MRRGIIKSKFEKVLSIFVLSGWLITGASVGLGGAYLASDIKYSSHSNLDQIEDISSLLNCVDNYRTDPTRRLQHNNGEPIYVCISEEISEERREVIIEVLDYIFGIIGGINSNYKYELVKDFDGGKYINKSTINIKLEDQNYINNGASCKYKRVENLSLLTGKGRFTKKCEITINPWSFGEPKIKFFDVMLHEFLHAFGLNDVYLNKVNQVYDITQINTSVGAFNLKKITPNDYKLLASMYHKPFKNEEEKLKFVNKFNSFMEQYEKAYYTEHQNAVKEANIKYDIKQGADPRAAQINAQMEMVDKTEITLKRLNGDTEIGYLKIKINDNSYTIDAFGKDKKFISTCVGDICKVENGIYLKNVELDKFVDGYNTCADVCFTYFSSYKCYGLITLGGEEFKLKEEPRFQEITPEA